MIGCQGDERSHRYACADNDPLIKTDPTGLRPDEASFTPCVAITLALGMDLFPGDEVAFGLTGAAVVVGGGCCSPGSPQTRPPTWSTPAGMFVRTWYYSRDRTRDRGPGLDPTPPVGIPVPGECHTPQTSPGDDCGLAVFMPGGDTPETTAHVVDALSSNPGWSVLTRASHPDSTTSRLWYQGASRCAGSPGDALPCDEYAFFTSRQGGPGASPRLGPTGSRTAGVDSCATSTRRV